MFDASVQHAVDLGREALWVTLKLSVPLLVVGLVVGLCVSLVQAVTQIQEQTLAFIPKILAVVATLFILLPWMLLVIIEYAGRLLGELSRVV